MSAVEEMSYEQIAAALGLSLGAVKTKIHRARLKLEQARQMRS
jgi:DNA-directed RNA polymerase specialized sigma24 family protein